MTHLKRLFFKRRPETPNAETIAAFEEVERMQKNPLIDKSYTDVDAMMKELLDDTNNSLIMDIAKRLEEDLGPATIERMSKVFENVGSDLYSATRIFYEEALMKHGFPFEVCADVPNAVTLATFEKAEKGEDVYGPFDTMEEMLQELNS